MDLLTIYTECYPKMLRCAMKYVSKEDAEDIIQDVIIDLWEKRDRLCFIEDLYAYAYSSVRNRCLDRVKHLNHAREHHNRTLSLLALSCQIEQQASGSSTSAYMEYKELQQRLDKAINGLPCRCKAIFHMSRDAGMKYHEISSALGISVNTVENQITIALRILRSHLKIS